MWISASLPPPALRKSAWEVKNVKWIIGISETSERKISRLHLFFVWLV
jgi:hypothetical protein